MTDQALKPDLSIEYCQIPECRAGKRGTLIGIGSTGMSVLITPLPAALISDPKAEPTFVAERV